ncbi:MAG TPA: GNAT family N-acetyltransferase [Actinomycetes bacterium]|nr:GNAT family N-acetyltransferase [Actinomycetes bacterium]
MTHVRAATVSDAAAVARIRISSWRGAYRGLLADSVLDAMDEAADTERWLARLAEHGDTHTLVSAADGSLTGFCAYGPDRDDDGESRAEIYAVYVLPHRWGLGDGSALLAVAAADLEARGVTEVRLWALVGNDRADTFYRRRGFAPDGAERVLDGLPTVHGEDALEVRYRCPVGRARR